VFTEVPLYFQYINQTSNNDQYTDQWEESNITYTYAYIATETLQTNKTKGKALQLSLPVTIYLAIKF
jgi:hypothetical protein